MRPRTLLSIFVLVVVAALSQGCAGGEQAQPVTDNELGLDKESVFATPDPIVAVNRQPHVRKQRTPAEAAPHVFDSNQHLETLAWIILEGARRGRAAPD